MANGDNATNTLNLIEVDAHERTHLVTSNEHIANSVGGSAKLAWNLSNWIQGDSINTTGGTTQSSWNTQYNNQTSAMLNSGTQSAMSVPEGRRDYSTFVVMNKDGSANKVVHAIDDGDRNIYNIKDSITRDTIAKNPKKYKTDDVGNTLFADDYINKEGDTIEDMTRGKDSIYGKNAEEMVSKIKEFEGVKEKPYQDSLGIMTIGVGINIDSYNRFKSLDYVDSNGNLATPQQKKELYSLWKSNPKAMESTKWKVTQQSINSSLDYHLNNAVNDSMRKFNKFDDYPTDARMGIVDMEFNMGGNRFHGRQDGWPSLFNAIENNDWARAARESERGQVQPSRNNWVKNKFNSSANE